MKRYVFTSFEPGQALAVSAVYKEGRCLLCTKGGGVCCVQRVNSKRHGQMFKKEGGKGDLFPSFEK